MTNQNPYITDAYNGNVPELMREIRSCLLSATNFSLLVHKRNFAEAAIYYMDQLTKLGGTHS